LIRVFPREDLDRGAAMRRFVRQVRSVAPGATGPPVVYVAAGEAVVSAFRHAFLYALAAIALLLALLVHPRRDLLLVLLPLLLAGIATGAATVLLRLPFNFANVIALPLLLGIGVDSGLHMVHRARAQLAGARHPLATSTARAVLYSALTTVCSFGNLAFSPHRGTASMGILLTLGVGFTLAVTLLVLPALLVEPPPAAREGAR
ncbi:MAG: hopanoid biosynthesis-associated RND transporter HpnN, partial [Nitrospirae bacterium]